MFAKLALAAALAATTTNAVSIGQGLVKKDTMSCADFKAAVDAEITKINEATAEVKTDNDAALQKDLQDKISGSPGYSGGEVTLEMVTNFAITASRE